MAEQVLDLGALLWDTLDGDEGPAPAEGVTELGPCLSACQDNTVYLLRPARCALCSARPHSHPASIGWATCFGQDSRCCTQGACDSPCVGATSSDWRQSGWLEAADFQPSPCRCPACLAFRGSELLEELQTLTFTVPEETARRKAEHRCACAPATCEHSCFSSSTVLTAGLCQVAQPHRGAFGYRYSSNLHRPQHCAHLGGCHQESVWRCCSCMQPWQTGSSPKLSDHMCCTGIASCPSTCSSPRQRA